MKPVTDVYRGQSEVCVRHLALQLGDTFSKLSLGGLWKLRVETLGEAPLSVLLVLFLENMETQRKKKKLNHFQTLWINLTLILLGHQ